MSDKVKAIPDHYQTVMPYLTVKGAKKAIEFYKKAFGATERGNGECGMVTPDGKVGHAEIEINGHVVMLADEFPDMGEGCGKAPDTIGGSPVTIALYVEDVDAVVKRAVDAGAKLDSPVKDQFYGDRGGSITDPFGHKWYVATHVEDVPPEEMKKRAEESMKQFAGAK